MTASAQKFQKVRLFLSSPGDVEPERKIVHKTAKIINNMLSDSFSMVLEVIDWKTHIVPDMGRPQELINEQVGDYDIFVGILWKRFGTPTGVAESGTEEEFYIAYENWKNYQKPRIMFYFSQVPFMPRTPDESEQMSKVLNFKSKFQADKDNPGLIFEYASVDDFGELIQSHLVKVLQEMFKKKDQSGEFVGFTSYLKYLKQETMYIDIRGLVTGKDKVDQFIIDDLYIPLKTRYSARHERSQPGEMHEMEAHLEETLLKEQRLFIKGEPGAGKTTFLRLIAYTLCQARLGGTVKSQLIVPDSLPLPLLIRVGALSRYIRKCKNLEGYPCPSEPDSPEWVIHFMTSQSQTYNWGLSADNFRAELRKGQCMILIDGLDEAANEDERGDISRLASNLVNAYRDCQIVLTSRPSALTSGDIVPLDFHTVEIAALDETGIRSFLDKWCSVLYDKAPDKSKQYKEELGQALNSHREIRRMSRTPVMLTALAVVHWNEHRLPHQRAELYESVLTWLFKARKDREGRLPVVQ
jgi:hypothetical protein